VIAHYLATVDTILRPKTVIGRAENLTGFALWLAETHPEIGGIPELTRTHIEKFLAFNAHRPSRGRRGRGKPISAVHHAHIVIDLRSLLRRPTAKQHAREYGEHSAPGSCRGTWSSPSAGDQMR
jgi:hypothetical protein